MAAPIELTLNDLIGVVQVIDLASSRGAFRGEDLLPVGGLREKIARYVNEQQKLVGDDKDTDAE